MGRAGRKAPAPVPYDTSGIEAENRTLRQALREYEDSDNQCIATLRAQVSRLTAKRDEARRCVVEVAAERAKAVEERDEARDRLSKAERAANHLLFLNGEIAEEAAGLEAERDRLREQVAAVRARACLWIEVADERFERARQTGIDIAADARIVWTNHRAAGREMLAVMEQVRAIVGGAAEAGGGGA